MLRLHPKIETEGTRQIVTIATNYSKEQIKDLFQLGRLTPVLLYKSKAKRLFDLRLSIADSKYLIQTKRLSVDEVVKCIGELKLDVELIKQLGCSNTTLVFEIPDVLTMVGGVDNLKSLIARGLSIENIKTLFGPLKLSYYDATSLIDSGYEISEIEALVKEKFSCADLVSLAKIIKASEVYSIFKEDKQGVKFLLSVISICKRQIKDLNSALECYQVLYDLVPNNLCKSLKNFADDFCPRNFPSGNDSGGTNVRYEEILRYYMDIAGGKTPMYVGWADVALPRLFTAVEKIIKYFNPSCTALNEDFIPIKPFVLAAIWLSLDMSLGRLYLENADSIDLEVVGRSILSFLISSMCGVTGYFHSGGVGLPFPNITSYIKTYFNIQCSIKEKAPEIYIKVPQLLKFNINQTFEKIIEERQIDAGRGLSMVYTFRVGNAFLCSLLGRSTFSSETAKNIFKSLWPLPQEAESIRMYFLYSDIPIYSKLNLKDVFVSIS